MTPVLYFSNFISPKDKEKRTKTIPLIIWLLAKAWDCGLYQVGRFSHLGIWSEWNGKYRDTVRQFIKGTDGFAGAFAECLCGSPNLYQIELKTAPADFRLLTTNQSRHCFTRYIEFHRCVAAKGDESGECGIFAKYYRSLCPGEWVKGKNGEATSPHFWWLGNHNKDTTTTPRWQNNGHDTNPPLLLLEQFKVLGFGRKKRQNSNDKQACNIGNFQ